MPDALLEATPSEARRQGDPLLSVRDVTVKFGGHVAVSEVGLDVLPGRIVGLIGPNGAGKTTTFNALTGILRPTSGSVVLDGVEVSGWSTHKRARAGIGRTFQRLEVFGSLTVRENVQVAAEIRRQWEGRTGRAPVLGGSRTQDPRAEADGILQRLGLDDVADATVGSLSTGRARTVELGRALAIRPRVLLLDEPASGQDESETEQFGELLLDLAEAGLGILLVEHDMPLVMAVCSTIYVLDFGRIIAHGSPTEVQNDRRVLEAYLGAAPETPPDTQGAKP